jgi:endonuclease IV
MQVAATAESARHVVGAHVSASGGCFNAVENARSQLGPRARSFAFFIRPRLTWRPLPPVAEAAVDKFHCALADSPFNVANVVVHGSYLINFGSHDAQLRRKSVELMVEEVAKCEQLGVTLYVFHPGAATGEAHAAPKKRASDAKPAAVGKKRKKKKLDQDAGKSEGEAAETDKAKADDEADEADVDAAKARQRRAESIQYVAQCVVEVLSRTSTTTLVLENTCGHGTALGRDFEELRQLLDTIVATATRVPAELGSMTKPRRMQLVTSRLGVCLDTCHAFASGYAMDSSQACDAMLTAFDAAMGSVWLSRNVLKVIHVNDSKDPMGSRRDRHANIGRGTIGMAAFQWLMTTERFVGLPLILETPRSMEKTTAKKRKQTQKKKAAEDTQDEPPAPSAQEEVALLLDMASG